MLENYFEFLLEDLELIMQRNTKFVLEDTVRVESVRDDIKFIKESLMDFEEKCNEHEELKILVTRTRDVAAKALADLDMFTFISNVVGEDELCTEFNHARSKKLTEIMLEMKTIKKEVLEIYQENQRVEEIEVYDSFYGLEIEEVENPTLSWLARKTIVDEEIFVGYDNDAVTLIERLVGEQKQLDVISIVGMAGLGKTMLARKVYDDPFIAYHFYIRGWIYVSQKYQKRDLLLGILSCIVKNKDEIYTMSDEEKFGEEKLGEKVYKRLKGMRYLIVMDSVWNFRAWDALRKYFPNDNNGSRILVTTRLKHVALEIKSDKPPQYLRFLTHDESWDLLRRKTFCGDICPPELENIGKKIAKRCQGLPLSIIVVAGFLSTKEKNQELWEQVAKRVSVYVGDTKNIFQILEMSYWNLPRLLKLCFLYLEEFQTHGEIPVWRLTYSWIAEGFIPQNGQECLEEVAECCLMELIGRSLVIPIKKSFDGKIISCRIHDLLHEYLSFRKPKEFQQHISQHRTNSSSGTIFHNYSCFLSQDGIDRRGKSMPRVHSYSGNADANLTNLSIYQHLKVLDMWDITLKEFPLEILQFIHLRFLALQIYNFDSLPPQIVNLWNLQTIILRKRAGGKVTLPRNIWKMQKLRHIHISPQMELENPDSYCNRDCSELRDLQTISTLHLSGSIKYTLDMIPNLKKLGLFRPFSSSGNLSFPNLSNFVQLHTLKVVNWGLRLTTSIIPQMCLFPPNLKKLTLSSGCGNWKEMSILGMLPNLEVLKLKYNCLKGTRWETLDGGFHRLQFLKLKDMDLKIWIASSFHFPRLQRLMLDGCNALVEIPYGLYDTPTLHMVELYFPSKSAADSARKIKQERYEMGDDELKIIIHTRN